MARARNNRRNREVGNNRSAEETLNQNTHAHTIPVWFPPSTAGRSANIAWRILRLMIRLSCLKPLHLFPYKSHSSFPHPLPLPPPSVCQTHTSNSPQPTAVSSSLPEQVMCLASGDLQNILGTHECTQHMGITDICVENTRAL